MSENGETGREVTESKEKFSASFRVLRAPHSIVSHFCKNVQSFSFLYNMIRWMIHTVSLWGHAVKIKRKHRDKSEAIKCLAKDFLWKFASFSSHRPPNPNDSFKNDENSPPSHILFVFLFRSWDKKYSVGSFSRCESHGSKARQKIPHWTDCTWFYFENSHRLFQISYFHFRHFQIRLPSASIRISDLTKSVIQRQLLPAFS